MPPTVYIAVYMVEDPDVVQLRNGSFAYRVECPWKGKNERV